MNSIVEFFPEDDRHRCGYCKSEDGSVTNGMWAHSLSVRNYQDLLDRGWRRSGKYCYKPIMRNTCCPLYTIKCDAVNFNLTKSQKKILRRVTKFLREGTAPTSECGDRDSSSGYLSERKMLKRASGKCSSNVRGVNSYRDDTISDLTSTVTTSGDAFTSRTHHSSGVVTESKAEISDKSEKTVTVDSKTRSGLGRDPSKPQCRKAKLVRQEKKMKKLEDQGDSVLSVLTSTTNSSDSQGKTLEDFIMESAEGDLKNTLILRLVPAESTPDMLNKSWQLYVKYQMAVHKEKEDECSFSSFKQFLVDSPLQSYRDGTTPSCGFGSFHHQYWLNGVLIALIPIFHLELMELLGRLNWLELSQNSAQLYLTIIWAIILIHAPK
ncbi:arginyl-tRNA--protein transferase 1 isoform X2 [Cimex lectularius]|uniref:Arginyl-tRNA--protein transferase 1 n=1 Tax=Cimex lectularius TaxID=79782 RepID=A0A8I6SED2_CIMLE|nr:arginyl-tRNA--protein transferase 1 isoform X2 [Cimex lectularius]